VIGALPIKPGIHVMCQERNSRLFSQVLKKSFASSNRRTARAASQGSSSSVSGSGGQFGLRSPSPTRYRLGSCPLLMN
jgi:hypothetical protein